MTPRGWANGRSFACSSVYVLTARGSRTNQTYDDVAGLLCRRGGYGTGVGRVRGVRGISE
jgi:hypothetical protein